MSTWDLPKWADHLREQGAKRLREYLRQAMTKAALEGERAAKLNATERLRRRSGRLAQSIRGSVHGNGAEIELRLRAGGGSGRREVSYARIQEQGGTVSPRRGRALAIPLGAARTAAGGLRGEFAAPGGLRGVPGLFVWKLPGRTKAFLARRVGDRLEVLFLLHRGPIRLRARKYLWDGIVTAQKTLPPAIERLTRIATGDGVTP